MGIIKDLTGKRFGRLLVLKYSHTDRCAYWVCRCNCGDLKTAKSTALINGTVKSCGCLRVEKTIERDKARCRDLTGERFGRLVVVGRGRNSKGGGSRWRCKCDCGNETLSPASSLLAGTSKSCGCYAIDKSTTHGLSGTPEYKIWISMKIRCSWVKNQNYDRYGGRGIKVCDRWINSFENFIADMGKKPSSKHSIDRIDSNKDYSPENCRWATTYEQARNTRKNVWVKDKKGKCLIREDWIRELGVKRCTWTNLQYRGGLSNECVLAEIQKRTNYYEKMA